MIDTASGELWIPNAIKFSGPNSSSTTNLPCNAFKRLHDVHVSIHYRNPELDRSEHWHENRTEYVLKNQQP